SLAKKSKTTVRDLLNGPEAKGASAFTLPEAMWNPDFQAAIRRELGDQGYLGFRQRFEGGARSGSMKENIDPAEEYSLWHNDVVNRAHARAQGAPQTFAERVGVSEEAHPKTGIPLSMYQRPDLPERQTGTRNYFSGFHNEKTGSTILGPPGSGHDDIFD